MPCPFYGRAAVPLMQLLIDQGGNRCALITEAHAPCRMEIAGEHPDLDKCEFAGSGRAIAFATFKRESLPRSEYPD